MLLDYDAVAEAAGELNTTIEGYVKSVIDKVREVVPEDVPPAIYRKGPWWSCLDVHNIVSAETLKLF
ncbi:MAG: hypothetical protein ACP5KA_06605 [Desulfurococcaceae archaeon]